MLDLHATSVTPGAATVLGVAGAAVCSGDFATTPGVPIGNDAVLVMHGFNSVSADTIGAYKMASQDCVDPINGEYVTPGAASLLNMFYKYTKIPYKTGARLQYAGTNTGVTACFGWTMDAYPNSPQPCVTGDYALPNQVLTSLTTFGGALTTLVWGSQAYAPATAIPNGTYAILGCYASAVTNAALIGFQHADFGPYIPGFPVMNYETISTSTWDKAPKNELTLSQNGYQFVHLSDVLGFGCCPTFRVTNAGTGLNIRAISAQGDTPVVILNLAKVG
jgi:hypothetical protein